MVFLHLPVSFFLIYMFHSKIILKELWHGCNRSKIIQKPALVSQILLKEIIYWSKFSQNVIQIKDFGDKNVYFGQIYI